MIAWLVAESHPNGRAEIESGGLFYGGPAVTSAGLAIADMSPEDVRALLAPVWDELLRGTLPLSGLPGATQLTFLTYRLRPLPGAVLAGLPVLLPVAAWLVAPQLGASEAIKLLQFTAVPLGLMAAFTVSGDVDAPDPVLAAAPHPYWRTPALRVLLWFIAAGTVVGLIGAVIDARFREPWPVDAAVGFARADLVLVAGLAFVFSIRWGSFVGGASALIGLLLCGVAERLWRDWPLRVLDTVGMPGWEQTRAWLLFAGGTCLVGSLLYLRARGLPVRHLFVWGRGAEAEPERPVVE